MARIEGDFDSLADSLEQQLRKRGTPYQRGAGDFSLIHDDYGPTEIGVIFLKPIFDEQLLAEMQAILRTFPNWSVWLHFLSGAEWLGNSGIVVRADGWESIIG